MRNEEGRQHVTERFIKLVHERITI